VAHSIVAGAALRIVASVTTILVMLLLVNAFTPGLDRSMAAGVSVGLAIAVSAIVESRLLRTPLSVRLVLLRAVVAGLIVFFVLSYLQGR
jgi:hypothetical protein